MDIGNEICLALFTSIFVTNLKDFGDYRSVLMKRWYDRGFKMKIKYDPDDEEDDGVNTKKKV